MDEDQRFMIGLAVFVWVVAVWLMVQAGRTPDPEAVITPPAHTIEEVETP